MLLIVGLGNPGRKYKKTRHNIGFRIIDEFQKENNFPKFKLEKKFLSEISEGMVNGKKIILAKPQTYMNSSGKAVKAILNFYKGVILQNGVILSQQAKDLNLIVIHDELDLPLGEIRINKNSGSAGHKGVKSIIQELGTQNFTRLRAGIKPKPAPDKTSQMRSFVRKEKKQFVLQKFTKQEEQTLKPAVKKACQTLMSIWQL